MKQYWKSIEEKKSQEEAIENSSIESSPDSKKELKTDRRDFLKLLGFGLGYATLAASCETPIKKAIPFLNKPEEITPGVANFYASTFFDGMNYCSILVKTREGRPIKIENNRQKVSKYLTFCETNIFVKLRYLRHFKSDT